MLATCQSRMRPTKGEMSVTPASAQATAWAKEKSSVMLQWMPCRSSSSLRGQGGAEQGRGPASPGQHRCYHERRQTALVGLESGSGVPHGSRATPHPHGTGATLTRGSLPVGYSDRNFLHQTHISKQDKSKRSPESHSGSPRPRRVHPHLGAWASASSQSLLGLETAESPLTTVPFCPLSHPQPAASRAPCLLHNPLGHPGVDA